MKNLIIRNGTVVGPDGIRIADVALEHGRIVEISASLAGQANEEMDASGLYIFPGFVDSHVHFNEPGRADWEGLESGPRALAAGGGTVFFDMPLNSSPAVLDAESLLLKRRIAEEKSVADFALWGGLCPGHTDGIPKMAEAGAVGFKAFMCPSGIDEFPHSDAKTLREGMIRAQSVGRPVAVHAEDPAIVTAKTIAGHSLREFFACRPISAEVSAIRLACELAGETGASLHVVHVTCAEGLREIAAARKAGVRVTAETCPHYLLFDADRGSEIGSRAKCAPPLRSRADVEALWVALDDGLVDTVGSDHSPAPPEMKTGDDFFKIWGGISGCQHGFAALLGEIFHYHPNGLGRAAGWLSGRPAERFGIAGKGRVEEGFDADLTLVSFGHPGEPAPPLYRHPDHLYEFHRPRCRVHHVLRRGDFLVRDSRVMEPSSRGRFLMPTLPPIP